jgi:hypothetical protein
MGAADSNNRIGEARGAMALHGRVEKRRFGIAVDTLELLGVFRAREGP